MRYYDKPLAERPLPDQSFFLGVVIGMAMDGGYSLKKFVENVSLAWPHVKAPPPSEDEL